MCAFALFLRNASICGVCGLMSDSVRPTTLMIAVRFMSESSGERAANLPGASLVALLQFVDCLDYPWQTHLVDFDTLADGFEKGNGECSSEMLSKLLKPLEDDQIVLRVNV